jgi:hypothetical protein
MSTKIAVGSAALRAADERDADLECVAINDLVDPASLLAR